MENLENSWNLSVVISMPREVLEKRKSQKFWKSHGILFIFICAFTLSFK